MRRPRTTPRAPGPAAAGSAAPGPAAAGSAAPGPAPARLAPARLAAAGLAAAGLAATALAGCGSSSTSSTATSPTTAPSASDTAPPTSAATSPTTAAPGFTVGAAPAVAGATDLTKEPTIAAGTPPPPGTPTGRDLVVGTGPVATAASGVTVQYVGALYDTGKVFDASWTDGNGPATFSLDQVIPGFKDAIVGMHVGGRREIVIPPAEGYGAQGSPPVIPGGATLVFVIDLLSIK